MCPVYMRMVAVWVIGLATPFPVFLTDGARSGGVERCVRVDVFEMRRSTKMILSLP